MEYSCNLSVSDMNEANVICEVKARRKKNETYSCNLNSKKIRISIRVIRPITSLDIYLPFIRRLMSNQWMSKEPFQLLKTRKTLTKEDNRTTGVPLYREGNWKLILNSHSDIFDERTPIDLKDKWRNMMQYGGK